MLNSDEEIFFDENNFSSLVASSLRNVIENSIVNPVFPYRILSLSHLSSWNTFQNDLIQILKRNSNINQQINQDLLLLHYFHYYTTHHNEKQHENSCFETLLNSHIDVIRTSQSDFDRLRQIM
ncbi:unnamed protein product [Rotaria socialis]|uniref:Uncharacterized protein n=1 Tax=Rotaria socialis TaxID=392032 RepID=A0A822AXN0_9BILA|nr:unnamed protein product [Rotaria socialis]CAF3386028.1 unnamed protein product [Rotaria socialis]CAF3503277.1 unnamed protein product [Rotaria socialis]CAF3683080.1 unnamed protein product [Rotaria socialis]CAF3750629.1 unnamed protein product [Rotaria socialis]